MKDIDFGNEQELQAFKDYDLERLRRINDRETFRGYYGQWTDAFTLYNESTKTYYHQEKTSWFVFEPKDRPLLDYLKGKVLYNLRQELAGLGKAEEADRILGRKTGVQEVSA